MELVEMLVMMALYGFVGIVAMILRAEDEPKTAWSKANLGIHLKNFAYGVVAAFLVAMVAGYDVMTGTGLLSLIGVGYLGLSAIKAYFAAPAAK